MVILALFLIPPEINLSEFYSEIFSLGWFPVFIAIISAVYVIISRILRVIGWKS